MGEAHGAEAEARRALAVTLDAAEMVRLANRLASDEARRNPFVRVERRAPLDSGSQPEASTLFYALTEKARARGKVFSECAMKIRPSYEDLVGCDTNKSNKSYETIELWIDDDVRSDERFQTLRGFAKFPPKPPKANNLRERTRRFRQVDGAADCQRDIATVVIDAKEMLQSSELIMETADAKIVYSAKLSEKKARASFRGSPAQIIDVGQMLRNAVRENRVSPMQARR